MKRKAKWTPVSSSSSSSSSSQSSAQSSQSSIGQKAQDFIFIDWKYQRGGGRCLARWAAAPRASPGRLVRPDATTADRQNVGKILLVFGCIGIDLCRKICVFQYFLKSIRLSNRNLENLANNYYFADFATFAKFLLNFYENC